MLWVKFCSMDVPWESHNFSLYLVTVSCSSLQAKTNCIFQLQGPVMGCFSHLCLPPRNKIPTICPTLNMIIWKLTMTVDFKALTEIPNSYHAQEVQQSLKAIAFNCGITKGTKHKRSPVFNFTSMRQTCLLHPS